MQLSALENKQTNKNHHDTFPFPHVVLSCLYTVIMLRLHGNFFVSVWSITEQVRAKMSHFLIYPFLFIYLFLGSHPDTASCVPTDLMNLRISLHILSCSCIPLCTCVCTVYSWLCFSHPQSSLQLQLSLTLRQRFSGCVAHFYLI